MKLLTLSLILLTGLAARASTPCEDRAVPAAIDWVKADYRNSNLDPGNLSADDWFFVEESDGVVYYGVIVISDTESDMAVNIGLDSNTCETVDGNYVTDP